jgi:1,4-dihydroxy-2-naphthoate octaprenyltransferase
MNFKLWFQAARPFSFTASAIPVLLGAAIAGRQAELWLLPFALVAGVLFQAGTNLVSDAYDFKTGVDRPGTSSGSGLLVQGKITFEQAHRAGLICFAIGSVLGLIMIAARGWPVAMLGAIGFLGGYAYCGGPKGYKYLALGDLMVGLLMGPLMVYGSYAVLTGDFANWKPVFIQSTPIACLVIAILHMNNFRDIQEDIQSGFRTVANLIGEKGSKTYYLLLVGIAYLSVVAMAATGLAPWAALIVFLSLKPALPLIQDVMKAPEKTPSALVMTDVRTAQLHLLFGVLMSAAIAGSNWLAH